MTLKHAEKSQQSVAANGSGLQAKDTPKVALDKPTLASSALNPLGEKIFLDRYALKDGKKETVKMGDLVIVAVNLETGQREIGTITALNGKNVTIELRDGGTVERTLEQIDKPLETHPSQMLDRVAQGIAAVEVQGEKQAEWQEKFRWLLDDWRFVPGGRILTAAGTDQNLTFYNCMPPEQEILTTDGYKPIAEVKVGDLVVTHRNRLRRVLHKFERETEEPLFLIKAKKLGFDALRVTGEHKVLAIRSEWVNAHRGRDGLRLQQEAQWIPARELKPGDYLAVAYDGTEETVAPIYVSEYISGYELSQGQLSKPQKRSDYHGYLEEGGTKYSVKNRLVVDRDLCYLFGRWLGDGCVTHRTKSDIPSGIKIVFALNQQKEAERVARIIEEKFGVPTAIKMSSTERWLDLWANSMPLGQFFKAFFGAYSYGKRIPSNLMRLPNELTFELIKGLFTADGYISGEWLGILLSNRTLAIQVHQMLLRLGYFFSIKENTHRLGRWPAYRITARASECEALFKDFFDQEPPQQNSSAKHYLEYDGLRWIRIDEIAVEDYSGVVLDIEVEEDHSFISAGLVVSNCYVIPSPKDSRGGIMDTLTQMTEIMSRGGGVGINISSLRPHHAYVKGVNGRSSGAVSWGELYSFVTGLIEQGGSRRGALMLIMNVWHPDVLEFINSKRKMGRITNANISVGITDDFMAAVKADADWNLVFPDTSDPDYDETWDGNLAAWQAAGKPVVVHKTVKAREIWNTIIESAWASAEPGVFFVERYNKMSNSFYFAPILCTNPCVTGDTLISTADGYSRARDLHVGMQIRTPAGLKPIEKIYNNGIQRIYRVEFSDGGYLECTADHKLKVVRGKKYEWVSVSSLRLGEKVLVSANEAFGPRRSLPLEAIAYIKKRGLNVANYYDRNLGFVVGVVIGDGVLRRVKSRNSYANQCQVAFGSQEEAWFNKFTSLMDAMNIYTHRTLDEKQIPVGDGTVVTHAAVRLECYKLATLVVKIGLQPNVKSPKKVIPEAFFQMDREFLAGILDGLFSTDGSVLVKQDNPMLRFHTASYELAQQVRLLLLQFGIHGRIYTVTRDKELEYDGRSMYGTGVKYDVIIMNEGVARFYSEIGLSHPEKAERLKEIAENWHFIGGTWTASVISVQDTEREEEVYDLYEPQTLTWITNGYVSLDCGEQGLPGWGVCNLGALNLARFASEGQVEWDKLGQAVRFAVRFLDNVIDATPYFFEENQQQQLSERRVGLGTMGLAEMLIRLKLRYGSAECVEFLDQLYCFIASEAYLASADYAAEKGVFPQFDADQFLQSGFMQGMLAEVQAAVKEKGIRNVTLLTQAPTGTTGTMVNTSTGIEPFYYWSFHRKGRMGTHEERVSVYEEWLTQHPGEPLPPYFVTAMDLEPEDHVRVQAAIQRWVDSSISKTCNTPNSYTVEQTRQLYELMYELGCKGGTIYRDGSRDVQVLNLKEEDKHQVVEKPKTQEIKWRARPATLHGNTYRKNTPIGTAYITVNANGGGDPQPFEVFINASKAGSDVAADAEGLGRLVSLILRMPSPLTPEERVQNIVAQLRGIGSGRAQGFGKNRVMSLPDAIAQALAEHAGINATGELPGLPEDEMTQLNLPLKGDYCPSCGSATLLHIEGCKKCYECGYSEC